MKVTVKLEPDEVAQAVRAWLEAKGWVLKGTPRWAVDIERAGPMEHEVGPRFRGATVEAQHPSRGRAQAALVTGTTGIAVHRHPIGTPGSPSVGGSSYRNRSPSSAACAPRTLLSPAVLQMKRSTPSSWCRVRVTCAL